MHKKTLEIIEACGDIYESTGTLTVRGYCYKLFARKLIPDMSEAQTKRISRFLVIAREKGLLPWEAISEAGRAQHTWRTHDSLEDWKDDASITLNPWVDQESEVVVVSEKSTIWGVIEPICMKYLVSCWPVGGFSSATRVHDLAEMIAGSDKPVKICYLGDHDPSGLRMSEKDIPERLERYGAGECLIQRVAVTPEQMDGLPSFSPEEKKTDTRYKWFKENYPDDECYEVDALEPDDLRNALEAAIKPYIDQDAWDAVKAKEDEAEEAIAEALEDL